MSKYIISKSSLTHAGIKGMRWGIRRYQNADGTLTELGKKRYARQQDDAASDGKTIAKFDAGKEVKKDLDATNKILEETGKAARTASEAVRKKKVDVERMDLSKMSDDEMRKKIERERLEAQYDSMFNTERNRVESGKRKVAEVLDGIGAVAGVTSSALMIALMIKQIMKG